MGDHHKQTITTTTTTATTITYRYRTDKIKHSKRKIMSAATSTDDDDEEEIITVTGKCMCGSVTYELTGKPMMNCLCHCNACSTGLTSSCAVHLLAMTQGCYKITEGEEDKLQVFDGNGTLKFYRCTDCGSAVMQGPEKAPFRAFYPRNFDGYVDGKVNTLPNKYKPQIHVNYENRLWDTNDELPKFAAFPTVTDAGMVNNDGTPIQMPTDRSTDDESSEQPSSLDLLEKMRTLMELESKNSGDKDTKITELEGDNKRLIAEGTKTRVDLTMKGKQFDHLRAAVLAAAKAVTVPPTTTEAE